jgi:DNA helicase-2/ATP-dependent DNA helicase PcrA
VQAQYHNRFQWLSIDEYQDVDEQQYRLVKLLTPRSGNLCAIGDPDQAIYGFRGADVRYFHRFVEDFPSARTVRLTRNYRSSRTIVAAASQIITAGGSGPLVAATPDPGRRITVHVAPSAAAEAEFVVHTIEQMIGGHSFFSLDSGRVDSATEEALSFSDFAVLYRTEAQAGALAAAFTRSGMPFQSRSHSPLLLHAGVHAVCARLQAAPGAGPVAAQLHTAVAHLIAAEAVDTATAQAALELLTPLAAGAGDDTESFLAQLALSTSIDTWDPRADRVSVLTLHAAKGLEFPVVFLVGCEDGLLPLRWGNLSQDEFAEERRLFYVGMTRAKQHLLFCRARRRLWRGQLRDMPPSPFLQGLAEQLLERQERPPQKPPPPATTTQLRLF